MATVGVKGCMIAPHRAPDSKRKGGRPWKTTVEKHRSTVGWENKDCHTIQKHCIEDLCRKAQRRKVKAVKLRTCERGQMGPMFQSAYKTVT